MRCIQTVWKTLFDQVQNYRCDQTSLHKTTRPQSLQKAPVDVRLSLNNGGYLCEVKNVSVQAFLDGGRLL